MSRIVCVDFPVENVDEKYANALNYYYFVLNYYY